MENSIHDNPDKYNDLHKISKYIGILFAIVNSLIFFVCIFGMVMSKHKPLPGYNYIFIASYGIYILGLLLGIKWRGLGGLICFIYVVYNFILIYIEPNKYSHLFKTIQNVTILMIPSILYLLSWYFHWRLKTKWNKKTST
jgi:hypothetical protein